MATAVVRPNKALTGPANFRPPPPPAAQPPATQPPDTQEAAIQKSAMSKLAEGLNGPSAGLSAAIGQGRNAVAQFAKDTQRQAAATAVKNGAVGQGTQTALGQEVRGSVMSKLAANEGNNAKMISDENKAFMDKALDIGQQNKQLAENTRQFDVSSGQNQQQINNQASQFNKSFGLDEKKFGENIRQFDMTAGQNEQQIKNQASQFKITASQNQQQIDNQASQFNQNLALQKDDLAARVGAQNTELLSRLGGDIPVIGAKLMDSALGKAGTPLSTQEKQDLNSWYEQQKAKGEKVDAQMDTLINKMVQDTVSPPKTAAENAAEAGNKSMNAILTGQKPIADMTPADWGTIGSDPNMMRQLADSNPAFKPNVVVPKTKSEADWKKAGIKAGDVVMQDGKPFKIVGFKTDKWMKWGNTRKNSYTEVIDLTTNQPTRLAATGSYDPD